jgi:hypothetical protein
VKAVPVTPLVKTIPVTPPVNPYLMTTRAKRGLQLLTDKLTLSATSALTMSPVPSFICAAFLDPNWHRAMEEEFVIVITNNT